MDLGRQGGRSQANECESSKSLKIVHLCSPEPRKKPSYFPLYWLVNRDPYNGLL